jgi:hypothetical protein
MKRRVIVMWKFGMKLLNKWVCELKKQSRGSYK